MDKEIILKQQVCKDYPITSTQAKNILYCAVDFSDAILNSILSTQENELIIGIRIPPWGFLDMNKEIDKLTLLMFNISKPIYSVSWGSDEEICRSSIYGFILDGTTFKLNTGDGERSGKFEAATSSLTISTTDEIMKLLKL